MESVTLALKHLPWRRKASSCCRQCPGCTASWSAAAEEAAEILKPVGRDAGNSEQDTVGAERSMPFRVTVVEAVMVPTDTPE